MIAEKIKALREARGWSQAELSRRLGITRNGVNSWEQGLSMPSPACLVDLAKVFGVSTDYLLGLERLTTVDVTGLADRDVAVLAELAERLKNCKPSAWRRRCHSPSLPLPLASMAGCSSIMSRVQKT